mgnify:CR=1 FL=1
MVIEVGALPNVNNNEEDQKFTYNIYKSKFDDPAKDIDFGRFSLQDYYGTPIMPSLNWVTKIKTGEVVYDPADEEQDKLLKDYEAFIAENGQIEGLPTPNEIIKQEMAPVLGQLAEGVGSSLATGGTIYEGLPYTTSGLKISEGITELGNIDKLNITTDQAAKLTGLAKQSGEIATSDAIDVLGSKEAITEAGGVVGRNVMTAPGVSISDRLNIFDEAGSAGAQNLRSAAGGAVGNFAVQLALGRDPVKAAKSAGAGAVGKIIGNAILPGIGGFIGGALGSIVGGRVICNELHNQGLITKKQLVNDYKFTRDYLTPTHVNGYHLWALWMVKQMRKGRFVPFWNHIVLHRANEISYIYGERDKPDYLGKVYRQIFEPTCWVLGLFCKETDWSVLYKQKEM